MVLPLFAVVALAGTVPLPGALGRDAELDWIEMACGVAVGRIDGEGPGTTRVRAYDVEDGSLLWTAEVARAPVVDDGKVYLGETVRLTADSAAWGLYEVAPRTGERASPTRAVAGPVGSLGGRGGVWVADTHGRSHVPAQLRATSLRDGSSAGARDLDTPYLPFAHELSRDGARLFVTWTNNQEAGYDVITWPDGAPARFEGLAGGWLLPDTLFVLRGDQACEVRASGEDVWCQSVADLGNASPSTFGALAVVNAHTATRVYERHPVPGQMVQLGPDLVGGGERRIFVKERGRIHAWTSRGGLRIVEGPCERSE